ncbi:MAG: MFS transporter [Actinomycetota bacterium]
MAATDGLDQRVRDRRPLYALLVAGVVSQSGNQMLHLAIPWFVLQTTGSVTKTGITAFFSLLPTVLAGVFGGPLVDKLGFKRTSLLADLLSGASVALIPLLHGTIGLEFWQLLALVFAGALLDAPGVTARYSLLPMIAGRAGISTVRATSLQDAVSRSSTLIGPPIAGVLIATIGTANVLWVDAATFLVSIALVALVVPSEKVTRTPEQELPYLESLKEGLAFVFRDRLLLVVILSVTVTNILDAVIGMVILPAYFNRIYGSAVGLGLVFGAFGGGALTGALAYGAIGHRFSRRWVFVIAFLLVALRAFPFIPVPPLFLLVAAMFVFGIGSGPLNPILGLAELGRTPEHMRGRVLGAIQAIAWGAMPLGVLAGGFLVAGISIRPALGLTGGLYVLVALSLIFNPGVKDLDNLTDPAAEIDTPPR